MERQCETHFLPNVALQYITQLDERNILFSNIKEYNLTRAGSNSTQTFINNCMLCIQTLSCGSTIKINDTICIIPNCSFGKQDFNETTLNSHVLNLQAIAPMLNEDLLRQLSSAESFGQQANLSLPLMNVYNKEYDENIKTASKNLGDDTLDLRQALNITLKQGKLFTTQGDHIIYQLENGLGYKLQTNWNAFTSYISSPFEITSKHFMIVQFLATGYLMYKVHFLAISLAARPAQAGVIILSDPAQFFHSINEAANSSTTSFPFTTTIGKIDHLQKYFAPTSAAAGPVFNYSPQISEDYHVLDAFLIVTIIIISICFMLRFARQRLLANTTEIWAEIINPVNSISIKLGNLAHTSKMYHIEAIEYIDEVKSQEAYFQQSQYHGLHCISDTNT